MLNSFYGHFNINELSIIFFIAMKSNSLFSGRNAFWIFLIFFNMSLYADLHNHTTCSDGDYTPEQLVDKAKELGLKVLGITDHDTLAGLKTAVNHAKQIGGIDVFTGVEVSLRFLRRDINFIGTLHYLIYIPVELLDDKEFTEMAEEILAFSCFI